MSKTPSSPALLSTSALREQLEHRSEPAFSGAIGAIDKMRTLYEALQTLHDTPNPSFSKEHRALRYADQYERARKAALKHALDATNALSDLEAKLREDATKQAKLDVRLPPAQESEVRAALRRMTPKERTKAIQKAAERGEGYTLNAVRFAPAADVTVGEHTAPIDSLVERMLHAASPTLQNDLSDIALAVNKVQFAAEAFATHTEKMRDPVLESRGKTQAAAQQTAEDMLKTAGA